MIPPGGTCAATTLRDRKKLATRRALQWAALDLIAERGYAHVTVEEIAAAAGVSTRTFFNYFPSKEAAVVGEDPELFDQVRASLLARPPGETAFEAVRAVLCQQAARVAADASEDPHGGYRDPTEWSRRMRAVHSDPHLRAAFVAHMATFERVIVESVAARLGTDPGRDPYPAVLAAAAMAAARIAVMYWSKSGAAGTPERLTDAAFAALAEGLAGGGDLAAALAELQRAGNRSAPAPSRDHAAAPNATAPRRQRQ